MRTLTLNELDSVSGGASGRDIAMAIGTLWAICCRRNWSSCWGDGWRCNI